MLDYKELLLKNLDVERLKRIKKVDTGSLTIELYDGTVYSESVDDILLMIECLKHVGLYKV